MDSGRIENIQKYLAGLPQQRQVLPDGQIISELADIAHELLSEVLRGRLSLLEVLTAPEPSSPTD